MVELPDLRIGQSQSICRNHDDRVGPIIKFGQIGLFVEIIEVGLILEFGQVGSFVETVDNRVGPILAFAKSVHL